MTERDPSDDVRALLLLLDGLRERGLEPAAASVGVVEVRVLPERRGAAAAPVGPQSVAEGVPPRSYLAQGLRELKQRRVRGGADS